ncbi:unnamed protein product, partial [Scytosiphon promiscuus]
MGEAARTTQGRPRCRRRRRRELSLGSAGSSGDGHANGTAATRDKHAHRRLGLNHFACRRHLAVLILSTLLLARSAAAVRTAVGAFAPSAMAFAAAAAAAASADEEGQAAEDAPPLVLTVGVEQADRRILWEGGVQRGSAGALGEGGTDVGESGSASGEVDTAGLDERSTGVPSPEAEEAAAAAKRAARWILPSSADARGGNPTGGNGNEDGSIAGGGGAGGDGGDGSGGRAAASAAHAAHVAAAAAAARSEKVRAAA